MKAAILLGAFAILATVTALATMSPEPVMGEHEDHVEDHIPVLHTTYKPGSTRGTPMLARFGDDGYYQGPGTLVRALISKSDSNPQSIQVCTEAAYREATRKAISMWNKGLGATVLELTDKGVYVCPYSTVHWNPTSIRVMYDADGKCGEAGVACAKPDRIWGHPWYARFGVMTVHVGDGYNRYSDNDKTAIIAHELGHLLGFSHITEELLRVKIAELPGINEEPFQLWVAEGCPGYFTYERASDPDGDGIYRKDGTTADSASDIPLIGERLRNHYNAANFRETGKESVVAGALMNWDFGCVGDRKTGGGGREYSGAPFLQSYDRRSFHSAYTPASVTLPRVGDAFTPGNVVASWTSSHVHAEKGFDVQIRVRFGPTTIPGLSNTEGWLTVASAPANATDIEFTRPQTNHVANPPYTVLSTGTSYGTYRIVSTTDVFGSERPRAQTISPEVTHRKPPKPPPPACTRTLTVGVNGSDSHGVTVSGHHAKNGNVYTFNCNNTATVTADAPDTGETFKWIGACVSSNSQCTIRMNHSKSVTAVYSGGTQPPAACAGKSTTTLTVKVSGSQKHGVVVTGHQSVSGNVYTFACGAVASLAADTYVPDITQFQWGGACTGTSLACSLVMDDNYTATAMYSAVGTSGGDTYEIRSRKRDYTLWQWSASCGSASSSGSGYATSAGASLGAATWSVDACGGLGRVSVTEVSQGYTTWGWSGSCYLPAGVSSSGSGYATSAAARSAAWAWAATVTCEAASPDEPPEPVEVTVFAENKVATSYQYTATCTSGGSSNTRAGYATRAAASSAGFAWLSSCPNNYSESITSYTKEYVEFSWSATCEGGKPTTTSTTWTTYLPTATAKKWLRDNCD